MAEQSIARLCSIYLASTPALVRRGWLRFAWSSARRRTASPRSSLANSI